MDDLEDELLVNEKILRVHTLISHALEDSGSTPVSPETVDAFLSVYHRDRTQCGLTSLLWRLKEMENALLEHLDDN